MPCEIHVVRHRSNGIIGHHFPQLPFAFPAQNRLLESSFSTLGKGGVPAGKVTGRPKPVEATKRPAPTVLRPERGITITVV